MSIPIKSEDLTTLIPASQAKQIADGMPLYQEQSAIAALINGAVNTGAYSVRYNQPISSETLQLLKDNGYNVKSVKCSAISNSQYDISWK